MTGESIFWTRSSPRVRFWIPDTHSLSLALASNFFPSFFLFPLSFSLSFSGIYHAQNLFLALESAKTPRKDLPRDFSRNLHLAFSLSLSLSLSRARALSLTLAPNIYLSHFARSLAIADTHTSCFSLGFSSSPPLPLPRLHKRHSLYIQDTSLSHSPRRLYFFKAVFLE